MAKSTSTGTLIASPSTVTFGVVQIGQTTNTAVSLLNNGPTPIQIAQLSLSGQPFTLVAPNSLPVTLAAGTTYSLYVQFGPGTVGTTTGQLTITSNSSGSIPQVISLTGTGVVSPTISVAVTPTTASTPVGATQQFVASVTGTSNTEVTWTLAGSGCSGVTCGSISSSGFYTAPAMVPSPAAISISATSVADQSVATSAMDTIVDPALVSAHNQWLAGVAAAAASYGCQDISIQQQSTESSSEAIARFGTAASEGSCLVLWPISTDPNSILYSLAWGGKVTGKDILYISDVGRMRIWNGVESGSD